MKTTSLAALACFAVACNASDLDEELIHSDDPLRAGPRLSVTPNPLQAGSIAVTRPMATGNGFAPGRQYFLSLKVGEVNASAMMNIGSWVTADKGGNISWLLRQDAIYGVPDALLAAPTGTLVAFQDRKSSGWTEVASTSFAITPNPGTCSVTPAAAQAGTLLTISGSGASAGASLAARWYDAINCTCWMFGCHSCTFVARSEPLLADSNGSFTGVITPAAVSAALCSHALTIQDETSHKIVATTQFSFCP